MSWFAKKKRDEAPPAPREGGEAPSGVDAIAAELCGELARLSEGRLALEAIDERAHIFDHGYLDSFRSAELIVYLERRFGVRVAEVELVGRLCTVRAIAEHIDGAAAAPGAR
jgi:acyl carrier protein